MLTSQKTFARLSGSLSRLLEGFPGVFAIVRCFTLLTLQIRGILRATRALHPCIFKIFPHGTIRNRLLKLGSDQSRSKVPQNLMQKFDLIAYCLEKPLTI